MALHTRDQSIAVVDTETGETRELRLRHDGDEVERSYSRLARPVTVGIESTGYALQSATSPAPIVSRNQHSGEFPEPL